ncbi:MAG: hypothetical protein ACON32_03340 [Pirellulaceae bacterium]
MVRILTILPAEVTLLLGIPTTNQFPYASRFTEARRGGPVQPLHRA